MRIAVAQIDPVVGAFEANVAKIREAYERACQAQARLLLTPELSVCGYPPGDLVDRPEMIERNERALTQVAALTKGRKTALIVGAITRNPSEKGRAAQNCAIVFEDGCEVFRQAKTLLPTYDVFDEARYFEPATEVRLWDCDGTQVAIAICEDLWADDPTFGRKLYGRQAPADAHCAQGAKLLLSLSASPYSWAKPKHRESVHGAVARKLGAPLVYVNQFGATDEVLFDGGSFAMSAKGEVTGRLPLFRAGFGVVEIGGAQASWASADEREDSYPPEIDVMARGLVCGIQAYFARTGFKQAILGLSGGIDSAVVAALGAKALGPRNVLGVAMPSQYSSQHSMEDAELLAKNLGMPFEVRPIKFLFTTANRELAAHRGTLAPLAQENLQARLRGLTLLTLSNHYGALVLTTGNKSELATGYCTMYGDMAGAIAPIGDVLKTRVYELARHINASWGAPIPERSITKAPSAELRPDQKDQDSLPPYDELDAFLADYLEANLSLDECEKRHPAIARAIARKLEQNEYKRRQAAPVLKVSPKAFGIGRRVPIAKVWDLELAPK